MRKIFPPVLIFVLLQVAWFVFISLWIYWFIQNKLKFEELTQQLDLRYISGGWLILAGGIALMFLIALGITFLFVYQAREARFNRLQGDFISSITHELKSPLASIQLYLETLDMRDPPVDDRREFVEIMLKDADRLSRLIDNVLVASRIRRGKFIIEPVPEDIYSFLEDFLNRSAIRYGWKPDDVKLTGQPGQIVDIDSQYMEMVLSNIISNAVKYSGDQFKLNVEVNGSGEMIDLKFTDHGVGINPKELKKVFRIFHRSPIIRRTNVKGTGLGLFIVRDVVRALGGRVSASSEGLGMGTTIALSFPRASRKGNKAEKDAVSDSTG